MKQVIQQEMILYIEFEENLGKEKLEEFDYCLGIDGKRKTVCRLYSMQLGNSTLEANDFSVSDLTFNWLNEYMMDMDLVLDDRDFTLVYQIL